MFLRVCLLIGGPRGEVNDIISGAMIKSGITQEELIKWGGPEVFNQALALCNSGDVKNVAYDDDTLLVSGKSNSPTDGKCRCR